MRRAYLLILVACSSSSDPVPAPAKPAAPPRDAAIADAAPRDPIRELTKVTLQPSYSVRLVGASSTVLITHQGDGAIATTNLATGAAIDRWKPTDLAELTMTAWYPGHSTKSGKPELVFDLAGRLPAVRTDVEKVRALMREAGTDDLYGVTISRDGSATIVKAGDLLYWLRDAKPPLMLDVGASYNPAVAPDGKQVAYNGCSSPCGSTYRLRIVALGDAMKPRISKVADASAIFWVPDGSALFVRSDACLLRVDAATLAATKVVCAGIEQVIPMPGHEGAAVLIHVKTGHELRTYATDGTLARTVALPSKHVGASDYGTIAAARDGRALVSIPGTGVGAGETFLVASNAAVTPVTLPGTQGYASEAIWIAGDHLAALDHDTIYVLDAPALTRTP